MKQEKGITLISLVITIILLIILAGVGISTSIDSTHKVEIMKFRSEMKIIHMKVNELMEDDIDIIELNSLGKTPIPEKAVTVLGERSQANFVYFDNSSPEKLLEKLGVSNIDREVIINFETGEVLDLNGIEIDGQMVYELEDWKNISFKQQQSEQAPSFTLKKKVYGLNATIIVDDVVVDENTGIKEITYKKNGDNNWHEISGKEINISVSGTYNVKVTDTTEHASEKTIEVILANKPKLDIGMTPVVYDTTLNKWKVVNENSGDWYDYASDKAQWANVMLQDGLVVNQDGTIDEANMGSMFVWIPRYMYKIPAANYHTSTAGEIDIKFLKGTTSIATDNTNVTIANASGGDNWNVHPAFCDGNKTNYANGEWDKDITGIWVAKFEASCSNQELQDSETNTTEYDLKVLPNVRSWRGITISNIFTVCRKMTNYGNIYNISSNSDTHMMKNSEWGVVAYLTQSKYGYLKKDSNGEYDLAQHVWNNPSSNYYTGNVGSAPNASITTTTDTYQYSTENGVKASTTGNIYGIYDMSGGAWEYVASVLQGCQNEYNGILVNANQKYYNYYIIGDGTKAGIYNVNIDKYGDATNETSADGNGTNSWNQDYSNYIKNDNPCFIRGGLLYGESNTGIFAYTYYTGTTIYQTYGYYYSFRPVCIVE